MLKLFKYITLFIFIISCKQLKIEKRQSINQDFYKISKIDSINNVYLIYAKKKDSIFKILSLKEDFSNFNKIEVGKSYDFKLKSLLRIKKLFGLEIIDYNVAGIDFYGTTIAIEQDSINDLHGSDNIKGLYYVK